MNECTGKCEEGAIEQRRIEIDDIIKAGRENGMALTVPRLRELIREEEELGGRQAKIACPHSPHCRRNLRKLEPRKFLMPVLKAHVVLLKPFRPFVPRGRWLN